ncbi:kinase-like protein [Artomyces pyxidatus]|uniref:Kinase-like protein n=1 Tax=Artomyces pyxidatus TaxID=48021 RepID=A0ACB8T5E8_9AGAM|nr:kinase-like protein [Artomyces pyxidatus]
MTSGSNSQEDGGLKSPGLPYVQSSPSARPDSPSTLAASPLEAPADEVDARAHIRRPSIIITTDVVSPSGITPSTVGAGSLGSASSSTPRSGTSSASPHAQRYPGWLSEVVKPLAEFIDECIDPRDLFIDLQEIAEGESGSVFSALVVATSPGQRKVHSFKPPTPTSPFPDSSVQELVAIKSVPILPSGSSKLFDLRRELELMRDLRHPNILKMERLYVDLVEDSLWIGMELMERSLADVLGVQAEEGGEELVVGEKMVARFVWDVLLALSYIRKQHIAHRDLRSDNLLLNRDGVLKISDFSSAVRAPPGTPKSSENVGVIYWQAPEMRTGLYDPLKVDVWSLGATTWELVEGEPPFSDVQDTRQIGQQLPPLSNPDIFSRSFHDFLHLCSQPVGSRPDPDELLNAHYIRTACPRSAIVQMLAQCKSIEEQRLRRQSVDSQGTFTLP